MAGHSKWANIKHRKARVDAKRGKIFSKIAKEIMVAARVGGGDPEANITLRALLQKARSYNMPADNIDRAIKKGTGEGSELVVFEELVYEGYAPGGIAVLVCVLTDNKNRSAAEVRAVFSKNGGNLGNAGSVAHLFQRKGQIVVDVSETDEETLVDLVLEAGAEDLTQEGEGFEILTDPTRFMAVVDALSKAEIAMASSELTYLPELEVPISDLHLAASTIRFVDLLDDLDDVQNVYANFNMDDSLMERVHSARK